jgi:hypothetical protein
MGIETSEGQYTFSGKFCDDLALEQQGCGIKPFNTAYFDAAFSLRVAGGLGLNVIHK